MQPSAVDESMELSSHSIGSRLQGRRRNPVEPSKKALEEASKKENAPMRVSSQSKYVPVRRTGSTTAYLNTEKLFKGMGMSNLFSDDDTDMRPDSPSTRKSTARAAPKPAAPISSRA